MTVPEDEIYDITIIGGGPVGLFAAFYAGLRGAKTKLIEALEELGGTLTAIYPEKYIYDIAGFPKVLAKDYVAGAVEQALSMGADLALSTEVTSLTRNEEHGLYILDGPAGPHYSRTVIISAGIGAFEPKRLDVEGISRFEGGRGVHYFAKRVEDFRDRDVVIVGGGDSAVDWAATLLPVAKSVRLVHRSKFRAHEHQVQALLDSSAEVHFPDWAVAAVHGAERLEGVTIGHLKEGHQQNVAADELIVAIGFVADLGPLKTWGLEVVRNTIVVDPITMATALPGVYGCGDIVTYPAKFKLIATGAAEAVTAVNHCVTVYDPSARLDPGHSTNIMEKREKAAAMA
ncbi:MAG TPA: NAD(P)/FAD-dependent oxidoreductase [Thermomicrobiales bacterium]|nr:NAD(P)/FAD-dependent oxidoreductase [Thermomicrobiales bacterium]